MVKCYKLDMVCQDLVHFSSKHYLVHNLFKRKKMLFGWVSSGICLCWISFCHCVCSPPRSLLIFLLYYPLHLRSLFCLCSNVILSSIQTTFVLFTIYIKRKCQKFYSVFFIQTFLKWRHKYAKNHTIRCF